MRCRLCGAQLWQDGEQGCTVTAITFADGETLLRQRWPGWRRCPDCGTQPEEAHHSDCDLETCPRCGRGRLECECEEDGDAKRAAATRTVS